MQGNGRATAALVALALLPSTIGSGVQVVKAIYAAIGIVWLCSVLGGHRLWVVGLASPIDSNSAEITAQPLPHAGEVTSAPPVELRDSYDPRVDLHGNELENAVADYRIDRGGAVYERHSPETAVLRLGSPTS